MDDHDVLISLSSKINTLIKHFENHLHQHFTISMALLGSGITIILTLVGVIVTMLLRQ